MAKDGKTMHSLEETTKMTPSPPHTRLPLAHGAHTIKETQDNENIHDEPDDSGTYEPAALKGEGPVDRANPPSATPTRPTTTKK